MDRPARKRLEPASEAVAAIPANVLVHVLGYADRMGLDCRPWFTGLGLERAQLLDPQTKVAWRQVRALLQRALRTFGISDLGLRIGSVERSGTFGLVGLLMMTADTFGDALCRGIANHEVSGSLLDLALEETSEDVVALCFWPRFDDPLLEPFLCEEMLASSLMLARDLLGPGFCLERVELTYPAPVHAASYAQVLGTTVRFDAPRNRALIARRWLAMPLPGRNPLASRQAEELCRQQLELVRGASPDIAATVGRVLRRYGERPAHIADVAHELNLSERSLRRRLAAAGTSFSAIHDGLRCERALALLHGGRLSIADIGANLGFSDAREFRRAFKRWTGVAPLAARREPKG